MKKTKLMGILNVSPDSFSDVGHFATIDDIVSRGMAIASEGADIIDIGGESTRPGTCPVTEEEEIERVIPVIKALRQQLVIPISVDTMKPAVALRAIELGATLINDVSGLRNPLMREIVASHDLQICVMHMQGDPQTMQRNPYYPKGVVEELLDWFDKKVKELMGSGIKEKNIILDPGIGFGKTTEHNIQILQNLHKFKTMGFPLLIGTSRKAFLGNITDRAVNERLAATLGVNSFAILKGADFLRIHDIKEHADLIKVLTRLENF
jgi:dihydropteroate synthase